MSLSHGLNLISDFLEPAETLGSIKSSYLLQCLPSLCLFVSKICQLILLNSQKFNIEDDELKPPLEAYCPFAHRALIYAWSVIVPQEKEEDPAQLQRALFPANGGYWTFLLDLSFLILIVFFFFLWFLQGGRCWGDRRRPDEDRLLNHLVWIYSVNCCTLFFCKFTFLLPSFYLFGDSLSTGMLVVAFIRGNRESVLP